MTLVALALGLTAPLAGCGDPNLPGSSLPSVPVYPVHGKVILPDGKPLPEGQVTFVPVDPKGRYPSGEVKEDGTFSLTTKDLGEGAPEGQYKVKIESDIAGRAKAKGKKGAGLSTYAVPPKYQDEDSSGLMVTIKNGPNDLEPFQLKAK
jgi:hypothetical protein